ncbi:DUF202 domain-containing protein [Micromonospora sp. DR5-3]|uniref:DUF202 domain-containing protein n=1 Tax=unclassified Micromonospora TaxID=2617518 RepID=UPI0011DB5769|nr:MULTISPECIES: DUF202 domain-containing protein [unclassified Micromonospora]MCW3819625.1 DUF202 domain-containing protein [Micromonospora sp. DR5-3]TYC20532.1 DUF202 domain-containing protein [Micromonospora sp. MP36]
MIDRGSSPSPGPSAGPVSSADRGLQVERTVLAWRRTATAFVVAAAGVGRFLLPHLGGRIFLAAVVSAAAVVIVAAAALRRRLPPSTAPAVLSSARPPGPWLAAVALATAAGGLSVALAVLAGSH